MAKRSEEKTSVRRRSKKSSAVKKHVLRTGILIALIVVVLGLIAYVGIKQVAVPIAKSNKPVSVLLVGSDMDQYREEHYAGTKPEKTDSLMVVTFDPNTYRVVSTSIPRDTAVDDACGEIRGKINEIYPAHDNDIDCLVKSVEGYLNVPIDYYLKVNMDQLSSIIDSVGPIKITAHAQDGSITQTNVQGNQTYTWIDGQTYEMDSDEALTYSRARHDSEEDYGRGIRQQQVILACAHNILENGFSVKSIQQILSMVDTNIEPVAAKKYVDYFNNFQAILKSYDKKEAIDKKLLPDSVWENMFKYFKYGEKRVTDQTVEDFQKYLINNFSFKEIKGYFYDGNQFYNDTYEGYYVTPYDQLKEISNKLRVNLGLKKEDPPEPQKPFGKQSLSKQQVQGKSSSSQISQQVADSDGDGVPDSEDVCPGYDDSEDSDGDGIPAGCDGVDNRTQNSSNNSSNSSSKTSNDSTSNNKKDSDNTDDKDNTDVDDKDSDGDGVPDSKDACPDADDTIDSDGNGVPDCQEQ